MSLKKILLFCLFVVSSLPIISYADITIINNTDYYGTGKFNYSPCSSIAGDAGIAKPHNPLTVPQSVISFYCAITSCTAHIYLSQNCSGEEVATATVDKNNGITEINNLDPDRFEISGGGYYVTIQAKTSKIKKWLNWLF